MYKYNKDEIKNSLTIEQVYELVAELGGEPRLFNNFFISRTICHNPSGHGTYKLYYYENTKLFNCYTDCGDRFDIFDLVLKHMKILGEKKKQWTEDGYIDRDWQMFDAVEFVAIYFGFSAETFDDNAFQERLQDWEVLDKYLSKTSSQQQQKKKVEYEIKDSTILNNLPHPRILPWEREGITQEVMNNHGIAYNPAREEIIIPHYDIDGNLIGIRGRTLVKELEKYGKYKPAILNGKMYNHALGHNLYNLNFSKENIKIMQKAIVFEGEKSPLLYASYFGEENDITVACCGSALISYQVDLLLSLGVKEIIIALDKQFKEISDDEWKKLTKNLYKIHEKYGAYVQISYLFDKENLLGYKDSPIDCGPDVFQQLFKERIVIE